MLILTIRTDRPEAEIGLFDDQKKLEYETWYAHRELSTTLHAKLKTLLDLNGKTWSDVGGIVCFQGPGSFTGLRIGLTVANAFAYGLGIPIVAAMDEKWIEEGISHLLNGQNDSIVLPHYGANANITLPKK